MPIKRKRERLSIKNPLFSVEGNKDNVTLLGYKFSRNVEYSIYKKKRIDVRKIGDEDAEDRPAFVYKKFQTYFNYAGKCISYYDSVSEKLFGLEFDAEYEGDNVKCLGGKSISVKSIQNQLTNERTATKNKKNNPKRMRVSRKHHHGNQLDTARSRLDNGENNNSSNAATQNSTENKRKNSVTVQEVFPIANPFNSRHLNVYKDRYIQRKEPCFDDLIEEDYADYLDDEFEEEYDEEEFVECADPDNVDMDEYYRQPLSNLEVDLNEIGLDESKLDKQSTKKLKRRLGKCKATTKEKVKKSRNEVLEDASSQDSSWSMLEDDAVMGEWKYEQENQMEGVARGIKEGSLTSMILSVSETSLERDLDDLLEQREGEREGRLWMDEGVTETGEGALMMFEMTREETSIKDKCMVILESADFEFNVSDDVADGDYGRTRMIRVSINDGRDDRADKWRELVDETNQFDSVGHFILCVRSVLDQHELQDKQETIGFNSDSDNRNWRYMELCGTNVDEELSDGMKGEVSMKCLETKKLFQECENDDEFRSCLIRNFGEEWKKCQVGGAYDSEMKRRVVATFKQRVGEVGGNKDKCSECVVCRDEYACVNGDWVRIDYGTSWKDANDNDREEMKVQNCVWYRLCKMCGGKGVCYECASNLLYSSTQSGYYGQQEIACEDCENQRIMQQASLPSLLSIIPLRVYYSYIEKRMRLPGGLDSVISVTQCGYCKANLVSLPSGCNDKSPESTTVGSLFNCSFCVKRSLCSLCGLQGPHWPTNCTQSGRLHRKIRMLGDNSINPLPPSQIRITGMNCPRCEWFVTKNGGCPHMSCICGCNFCWNCGGLAAEHGTNFPCYKAQIRLEEHEFFSDDLVLTPSSARSKLYCKTFEFRLKQHPNLLNRLFNKISFINQKLILSQNARMKEMNQFKDNYILFLRILESLTLQMSLLNRKSQSFQINYYKRIFGYIQFILFQINTKVNDIYDIIRNAAGLAANRYKMTGKLKSVKLKTVINHQQIEWMSLMEMIWNTHQFIEVKIALHRE